MANASKAMRKTKNLLRTYCSFKNSACRLVMKNCILKVLSSSKGNMLYTDNTTVPKMFIIWIKTGLLLSIYPPPRGLQIITLGSHFCVFTYSKNKNLTFQPPRPVLVQVGVEAVHQPAKTNYEFLLGF